MISATKLSQRDIELAQRVFEATADSLQMQSIHAIRDDMVISFERSRASFGAFADVIGLCEIDDSRPEWRRFGQDLEDRKVREQAAASGDKKTGKTNWTYHVERLMFISMRWSPEMMSSNGWTTDELN